MNAKLNRACRSCGNRTGQDQKLSRTGAFNYLGIYSENCETEAGLFNNSPASAFYRQLKQKHAKKSHSTKLLKEEGNIKLILNLIDDNYV